MLVLHVAAVDASTPLCMHVFLRVYGCHFLMRICVHFLKLFSVEIKPALLHVIILFISDAVFILVYCSSHPPPPTHPQRKKIYDNSNIVLFLNICSIKKSIIPKTALKCNIIANN